MDAGDSERKTCWNRYAYANNDPVGRLDPTGLEDFGSSADDLADDLLEGQGNSSNDAAFLSLAGLSPDQFASSLIGSAYDPSLSFVFLPVVLWFGAPNHVRVPNKITCSTVLPNGRTVGSYVSQLASSINGSVSPPTPSSVASQVFSGTNFRKMFGGQGANYAFLGDAGNFAYGAVSADLGVPLLVTELAAGAYTVTNHQWSDLGPYGMDPSARVEVPAGYKAACKD